MDVGKKQTGFTIVELLIVVVVIAILAAITIVAYNGIQNRANASAAQAAVSQAAKKLYAYAVDNADTYPEATGIRGTDGFSAIGIAFAGGTSYQYSANSTNKTFCLTATTKGISYYLNNTNNSPVAGACPGHDVNGTAMVTNLVSRPIPTSTTSFNYESGSGSGTLSWATTGGGGVSNAPWQRLTLTSGSTSGVVQQGVSFAYTNSLAANTTYTWSIYVRSSSAVTVWPAIYLNPGNSSVPGCPNTPLQQGVWTRISCTFTVTQAWTAFYGQVRTSATFPAGATVDVALPMMTAGSTLYTYGDGTYPGWSWMNNANASPSYGPAT